MSANSAISSPLGGLPFGQLRSDLGSPVTATDFGYTGQRNLSDLGLMDYHARFYDDQVSAVLRSTMRARTGGTSSLVR